MDKATFCALFREAFACEAPQLIFVKQYAEYADAAELRSIYAMAHAKQRDLIYASSFSSMYENIFERFWSNASPLRTTNALSSTMRKT